ncbi:hypothetical protein K438DRAFT_1851031 [Mycena galopus ATCC 62051]|nr:hypothetical protein K438DRAFT_1851031 [Mycena galopus ATCC 62051]
MSNHLPDEIISEILSPALRVSDVAFSTLSGSDTSPFMRFSESSSAFLVVCKAWLRVATPLLYSVVVLRSKAQAQALAAALKENPDLGLFIKKLRVEGGYAISMHKILQTSKNITDLFLSMTIATSDNACGLCRGLPLLNPVRVIVDAARPWTRGSKEAQKLLEKLAECIPTWKKMTVLEVPSYLQTNISDVLVEAPNLQTLVVWTHDDFLYQVPPCIRTIAANPSLKRIRVEPPLSPHRRFQNGFYNEVMENSKLKALLGLVDESCISTDDDDSMPPCPFVYPARLAADAVQEDTIWSRVLYFALYRDGSEVFSDLIYRQRPHRLSPILVCKKFARLGIPHLYTTPKVPVWALELFRLQLAKQPHLGDCVRRLTIHTSSDVAEFKRIIGHATKLEELDGGEYAGAITWKAFSDVGESAGASLRSFRGIPVSKATGGSVDPNVFTLFSQMQKFDWSSATVFKTEPKSIPSHTFGLLVDLKVSVFHASFLQVLSHMELPALRTAAFSATAVGGAEFFHKHGAKLRELTVSVPQLEDPALRIWHNCPSLTLLGVSYDDKHLAGSSCLETTDINVHLERIVFRVPQYYRFKQAHQAALGNLLLSLHSTASFPALREIEHPSLHWPTTEPEISKSRWVKWAESLHERDIHLVDSEGVRWRPRLKFVPKTKQ